MSFFFKNKILSFFIFSCLNLLMYGISPWEYTIYNFDQLYYYLNSTNFIIDPILQSTTFGGYILNKFNLIFSSFLQIPILYVLSSLIVKTLIYFSFYKISSLVVKKSNLAFVITLFFLTAISSSSHLITLNGFWGAPIFFRSSVSGLLTLVGLFLLIDKKVLLSIIPFALSIHLHAIYGLTAFAFIFSSYIFYSFYLKKQRLNFFLLTIIIFINALLILFNSENISYESLDVTNEAWLRMLFINDPDDVSIFFSLGRLGYFTILWIISSLYFVLKQTNKKTIDYLFLGSFGFFILILIFETLHFNLIFIEFISEKFIAFQFRRGMWVLMFFSTIVNITNIYKIFIDYKKYKFPLLLILLLFLKPDPISLFFVLLLGIFYYKKFIYLYLLISSTLILIFGLHNNYFSLKISSILINFSFIIFSSLGLYFILKYKKMPAYSFFVLILMAPILTNISLGLYKETFLKQIQKISSSGLTNTPNIKDLEINVYESQGKKINYEIIDYIRTHNDKNDFVLESFDNLFYGDPILYDSPVYISRYHYGYSLYSKNIYGNLLLRINNLFPFNYSDNFSNKSDVFNYLDQNFKNLKKSELETFYTNFKIRFVILKNKLDNYVIEENGYFLYDLKNN